MLLEIFFYWKKLEVSLHPRYANGGWVVRPSIIAVCVARYPKEENGLFILYPNLLTTAHDLVQMYDSHKQIDVTILDFSTAFDTVPYEHLVINSHITASMVLAAVDLSFPARPTAVHGRQWCAIRMVFNEVRCTPGYSLWTTIVFIVYHWLAWLCVTSGASVCRRLSSLQTHWFHRGPDSITKDLDTLDKWSATRGMKFNPSNCNIISLSMGQTQLPNSIPCIGSSWTMFKRPSI